MTKPIIVVKICYKLLYVIQVVKKILVCNLLISKFLVAHTYLFTILHASDWPCTFYTQGVFVYYTVAT